MVRVYIYVPKEYPNHFWRDERIDDVPMSLRCYRSIEAAKDNADRTHPGISWDKKPKLVPAAATKDATLVAYGEKK